MVMPRINSHVDSNVRESAFTTASRCVVYVGPDLDGVPLQSVGVIQGYGWGEQRQIDLIFELGSDIPYLIPGRTTGQISLSRMLIYGKDLTNAIYGANVNDPDTWKKSLREINVPCRIAFASYSNDDTPVVYSRIFSGAWITSRNESIGAGQTVIAENVNIMYQQILDVELQTVNT